ncbi:MAG: NAD(P)H-dependent oxidoreductase [Cytophagales bacterium]|nr:MAG: NAD(P)H-dependent oxidoreductase [Cytophagales bacterium]
MHIAIISSSTRQGRQSHRVALALQQLLSQKQNLTAEVIDLLEYRFPVLEEVLVRNPNPPSGLENFSEKVQKADALIFLSPEYNGSYTAALKNAVDYLKEGAFTKKVIGVVSVTTGGLGGMRGAMQMQELVLGVSGYALPNMLLVPQVQLKFDEQGNLIDEKFEKNIQTFLQAFLWIAEAVYDKKNSVVAVAN